MEHDGTGPKYSFGGAKNNRPMSAPASPGPAAYDPVKMGIAWRKTYVRDLPENKNTVFTQGPARYNDMLSKYDTKPGPQNIGGQALMDSVYATRKSSKNRSAVFGTGPQRYHGTGADKDAQSRPAPNKYGIGIKYNDGYSACGRQVNSRYKGQPQFSFGAR